ncbi:MAG: hypothetical protein AB7H88_11495 [Vicinamibacterales bacterium]
MNKPVFAMLLGGVLGIFDGLTALLSAPNDPDVVNGIVGIVLGSTFKGVIVGLIVGLVARRTESMAIGVAVGLAAGLALAYLVTLGGPYFWEIMLPGGVVGLIVGYATFRYGGRGGPVAG